MILLGSIIYFNELYFERKCILLYLSTVTWHPMGTKCTRKISLTWSIVTATTYFYSNLIINTKLENKMTGVRNRPSRFIALIFFVKLRLDLATLQQTRQNPPRQCLFLFFIKRIIYHCTNFGPNSLFIYNIKFNTTFWSSLYGFSL